MTGGLPADGQTWYVVVQGCVGVVQFSIALVMLADYRRCGVWGRRPGNSSAVG